MEHMHNSRRQLFENLITDMQRASKAMLHEKNLRLNDLPFGQRAALFTIAIHEMLPVKKLASELQITSGAATQHAEALVSAGLAERVEDKNDRRVVHLTLSRAGRKRMQDLKKERLDALEKLFSNVDDKELQAFSDTMKKVSTTLSNQVETKDK